MTLFSAPWWLPSFFYAVSLWCMAYGFIFAPTLRRMSDHSRRKLKALHLANGRYCDRKLLLKRALICYAVSDFKGMRKLLTNYFFVRIDFDIVEESWRIDELREQGQRHTGSS